MTYITRQLTGCSQQGRSALSANVVQYLKLPLRCANNGERTGHSPRVSPVVAGFHRMQTKHTTTYRKICVECYGSAALWEFGTTTIGEVWFVLGKGTCFQEQPSTGRPTRPCVIFPARRLALATQEIFCGLVVVPL